MGKKLHNDADIRARSIDWAAVHHRLEMVRERLESGWNPSHDKAEEILRARAKALAQERTDTSQGTEFLEVVEFTLAYEHYGVETAFVREVYPLKDLTHLPGVPSFVLGIINMRGKILSVLDLKKFFDLPEKGLTDLNKVIVLNSAAINGLQSTVQSRGDKEFGILADEILGVKMISVNGLQPALPTMVGIREEYLKGLTPERIVILDGAKLLADKKIVVSQDSENN